jgi:hypothetical protein
VEIARGNRNAKNWQEEALKVIKNAMSLMFICLNPADLFTFKWDILLDEYILEKPPTTPGPTSLFHDTNISDRF